MKKPLYLILPLLFAFAFLTCEEESEPPPKEEPLSLDQRLVGGRWYFPNVLSHEVGKVNNEFPEYSDGYYVFTTNSLTTSKNTKYRKYINNLSEAEVYSKDGIIYLKENNQKIMRYEFHDKFPYDDEVYEDGYDFFLFSNVRSWINKQYGAKGNLITYRLYDKDGKLYKDDLYDSYWFLLRYFEYEYEDPND